MALDDLTLPSGEVPRNKLQAAVDQLAAMARHDALTDSSGGTAGTTIAAGVGRYLLSIPINLVTVADGDVLTALPIPHRFAILAVDTADAFATLVA